MTPTQARSYASANRSKLYTLARTGMLQCDDAAFWTEVNPLGVAIYGDEDEWQAELTDVWCKATPTEGYNGTFELLGLPPLPELTFEQFKATGRDVADLRDCEFIAAQTEIDSPKAGRVYLDGGLWIEKEPDGNWSTTLEKSQQLSRDLESLELALYSFYCTEYA